METAQRLKILQTWLAHQGYPDVALQPVSGDAGARQYYRIQVGDQSRLVMDAPAQVDECHAYLEVQKLMAQAGLHVPRIDAADPNAGFMLIEDLGARDYLAAVRESPDEQWWNDAISALVRWQAATRKPMLPHYGADRLSAELELFPTWYVSQHLGVEPSAKWQQRWAAGSEQLITAAINQPQVWVHRDFMLRNLLVSSPNPGVIDFQDALTGPVTYDLVSLLRDAFFSLTPAAEAHWIDVYANQAKHAGIALPEDLLKHIDLMGAQRHLKVLGIFARLRYRDGKPHYLDDAPRFLQYLAAELAPYPAFADFADLIADLPEQ